MKPTVRFFHILLVVLLSGLLQSIIVQAQTATMAASVSPMERLIVRVAQPGAIITLVLLIGVVMLHVHFRTRRRLEHTLHESRSQLMLAFEATLDGLFDLYLTGRDNQNYFSPNFYTMLGYDPSDFVPSLESLLSVVDDADQSRVRAAMNDLITGRTTQLEISFRAQTACGGWRYLLSRSKVVAWNRDGTPCRLVGTHTDITKRWQTEQKFRTLFEQSSDAYLLLSESGFLDWNPMAARILKLDDRQQLYGMTPDQISPQRQPDGELSALKVPRLIRLARKHGTQRFEWTHRDFAGGTFPVQVTLTPIRLDDDELFLVIWHDLSERYAAEAALRDSQNRYQMLFDNTADAMFVYDVHGRFLAVNRVACDYLGYDRETLSGMSIEDIDIQAISGRDGSQIRTGLRDHGRDMTETLYRHRDGTLLPVETSERLIDYDGNKAVLCIARDIRQRKATEEQVRVLSQAIEHSPTSIMVTDVQGVITYVNSQFTAITGYSAEEAIGQTPKLLNSGEQGTVFYEGLWGTILSGRTWRGEIQNRKKSGELYWELQSISPIRDEIGNITHFVAIKVDDTERKQSQAELQRALRLAEDASRARGIFLANMSHELRSPLNIMLGFSQVLRRDDRLHPAHQETLETIISSGEHLLSLINDVLEMSRIEAGKLTATMSRFDLHELLRDIEKMLRLHAQEKGLHFRVTLAPDVPRYIESDARKLRQVLINLLTNAIKYTAEGSVDLLVRQGGDLSDGQINLCFEVSDTGFGITPDAQKTLFAPFVRAEHGDSTIEGTGLGLSISQSYVRLLGGDMTVESIPGAGSTFRFNIQTMVAHQEDLPLLDRRQVIGIKPDSEIARRILVIDDNPASRDILLKLLASVGLRVRGVRNGAQLQSMIRSWQPDLIFMDVRMPEIGGYDAITRLRALLADEHIPIIALSASVFAHQRDKMLLAGCDDFVGKPWQEHEIFNVLGQHLHLEYQYADSEADDPCDEPGIDPVLIASLPASWRERLYHTSMVLDIEEARQLIAHIRDEHPVLANQLEHMVQSFQFDKLRDVVGQ